MSYERVNILLIGDTYSGKSYLINKINDIYNKNSSSNCSTTKYKPTTKYSPTTMYKPILYTNVVNIKCNNKIIYILEY